MIKDSGGLKDVGIPEEFLEEFNLFVQLFLSTYYVPYADNIVVIITENILMEFIVVFRLEINK